MKKACLFIALLIFGLLALLLPTSALAQRAFVPQKATSGFCYNAALGWIVANTSAASTGFVPQEATKIYGANNNVAAPLACDANGNLYAGDFNQGSALPATCSPGQVFTTVIAGTAAPYYCSAANTWSAFGGSGVFVTLAQDAISQSNGSTTEVVGLLTHPLPSLTTGYLNWTGTAWELSAVTSGVSSVSGDGTLITNSASTGAVTLTLGYTPANCTAGTSGSDCLKLSSGLVPAANLPTPSASTLGGIESITSASHEWVSYIDTSGVPHQSQPAIGDISGLGTGVATALGNAVNGSGGVITTATGLGTLANLPQYSVPYSAGTSSALTDVPSPAANGVYALGWDVVSSAAVAPASFQLTGSGISCIGSPLVCTVSGGTGSGTVSAAAQYDVPYYTQSGTVAQVGGAAISGFQFDSISGAPAAATAANLGALIDVAQYDVLVSGGTAAAVVGVAPSSTSGLPFVSQGASANPTYAALALSALAAQATNTITANVTSGSAAPTAVSVSSCSAATDALIWTTNTGPGCNTSITAAAVPLSGITGLGTGVATALGDAANGTGGFLTQPGVTQYGEIYSNGTTSALSGVAPPTTNADWFTGYHITGSAASAPINEELVASTTNSVGLTVTPTYNATGPTQRFEITGSSYTGNAATVTTAASTTNSAYSILSVPSTSGSQEPYTVSGFTINPSTGAVAFPGSATFAGSVHGITIAAGTQVSGITGDVVYASDTSVGYAEVNENSTGYSRICTAANGICAGSTTFQVNGTGLSSSTTVNFENSSATDGLTLTFTNPSAGNVQLGFTGSLTVPGGGTGVGTLSGFAYGNATSAFTAATAAQLGGLIDVAQYDLLVSGGTAAAVAGIAPSSTSGLPLTSGGSSANPSFAALTLAALATQTADTMVANMTASTASPTAVPIPTTAHGVWLGEGTATAPGITAAGASNTVLLGQGSSADPSFGAVPLAAHATQSANTVVANVTGSTAAPTAAAIPSGIQNYVAGTGYNQATGHQVQVPLYCPDTSGSGTAQSCSTGGTTYTPAAADYIIYTTTTTNSGTGLTVNVNSLGAKSIAIPGASGYTTTLTASIIPANKPQLLMYDGTNWDDQQTGTSAGGGSGTVNSGTATYGAYYPATAAAVSGTAAIQVAGASSTSGVGIGQANSDGLFQLEQTGNVEHTMTGPTTVPTFNGSCASGTTTDCVLTSVTGLATSGAILVGNSGEIILYTGVNSGSNEITGLTRGAYGTTAAAAGNGQAAGPITFIGSCGSAVNPWIIQVAGGGTFFPACGSTGAISGASSLSSNAQINVANFHPTNAVQFASGGYIGALGTGLQVYNSGATPVISLDADGIPGYLTGSLAVTSGTTTIAPVTGVVNLTGTAPTALATITAPSGGSCATSGFSCQITFIGVGFTTVTSGNIGNIVTAAANVPNICTYLLSATKWYCN